MGAIEGIYIFDEHNRTILEHVYAGRPQAAAQLVQQYLAHPSPRPSLINLPNAVPATLLFSSVHDRLLFLCPVSTETEPLVVLEFLHRLADALEEFLGAPLLASKIEGAYDVVAQIVGEMCDAGTIATTEPNALSESVETLSWMGSILGGLGLPASAPALGSRPGAAGLGLGGSLSNFPSGASSTPTTASGSAIPWRRANVRHTSNELYVDMVESLNVVLAPSGRPISAFANGTIAFTSKISGVPDLLLRLSAPGGTTGIEHAMDLPCFHPCVRLARWRDRPGELTFVPPDGKFVLAGYELETSQGTYGDELEVRLTGNPRSTLGPNASSSVSPGVGSRAGGLNSRLGTSSPALGGGGAAAPTGPPLEDLLVTIPIPSGVRHIADLRASRGEAHHLPSEGIVDWRISSKEAAALGSGGAVLRCTLVGPAEAGGGDAGRGQSAMTDTFDYDEATEGDKPAAEAAASLEAQGAAAVSKAQGAASSLEAQRAANATLMPKSACLSFSVRGWLASGIRVDGLEVLGKTSKGLGAGVTPYKGVKYHTVSRQGIEARC